VATGNDIWLLDVTRQNSFPFTFDPAADSNPVWSPDGSRIVYSSNRSGPYDLYWKLSSGAGNEELLFKSENAKFVTDWSHDGRFILYQEAAAGNAGGIISALPMFGEQKPIPIAHSNFYEGQGKFSSDGRWIAYVSNESGANQVWVQNFPSAAGKSMVSINGGSQPQWRWDGKELFYVAPDAKLMVVQVKTVGNNFEAGTPRPLFEMRAVVGPPTGATSYAPTHDGRRFLVNMPAEESSGLPVVVIQNWTAALRK